jgi:hypothetical protein
MAFCLVYVKAIQKAWGIRIKNEREAGNWEEWYALLTGPFIQMGGLSWTWGVGQESRQGELGWVRLLGGIKFFEKGNESLVNT